MKIFVALLLAFSLPAWAAPSNWAAGPDAGNITFTAYWNGTPVTGHFPKFQLTARLDPAHPAGGSITLDIATSEIKTQSADITAAIRGDAWFDVKSYPKASFVSESIVKETGGLYQLRGELRIKGHEKTVVFPLRITCDDGTLELTGKLTLDRTDFAIGSGQWSGGDVIAHKVNLAFRFVLAPAG
ncbi:MAG: YceI family protein [Gammaproteobacteria bacterium]|nr:YceI family protein [Gammaproteobacteria bacterium]